MPSKKNALKLSPALLTVAEKSDYRATSKYDDVRAFLYELKSHSSQMTLHVFGKTTEGRDLLLAAFSEKPVYSPIQALKSQKPVVLLQNNIHAGEVCPKEASMKLMRELVFGDLNALLKDLIVLVIPIYNADGNERVSEANRLSQIGPELGVGVRTNALGLDLNRDYMKIEAQETEHLIRDVYVKWSPDVIIDGHTTDGSRHGYDLTYGFPQNPNAYKKLIDFARDAMLPAVRESLKKNAGIETFYYADFVDFRNPEKGWATYSHHARYGASYGGLQNRLAILMETYSYIPFKRRIEAAYGFMRECLAFAAKNAKKIKELVREAETDAIERGEFYDEKRNVIGIEIEKIAFEKPVTVIGYEIKEKKNPDGSIAHVPTTKKKLYRAPYFGKYRIARSVPSPFAYLLPKAEHRIARKLQQHGVVVEALLTDFAAKVERFDVKDVKVSEQCFQGHREVSISVERLAVEMTFRAGDFVVPMNQPASRVAAGLLEPDSDDSLAHWNYFDNYLTGKLRYEKDFVTEYEYNLIDLPRTREIYERLIEKNPALNEEQKQAEKMKFFMTAVGYENEFMNQIPVYRLVERKAYSAVVVAPNFS